MLKPFLVVSNIYFSKLLGFIRIRSQYSRNDIIAYSQQCSLIHQEHIEVYKKDNYCKKENHHLVTALRYTSQQYNR